jgi:acidic leucine-rich nuclear phosphoprotein 32 family protein A/C/D
LKVLVEQCPLLYKIKIEKNNIESLDKLKCLAGHKIRKINLEGNPLVQSNKEYRKELFELIPSLLSIDGIDKNGNVVESTYYGEEEDEEGFEGGEIDDEENEEIDDGEDGGEDDDEEDENKPNKKPKN